MNPSVILIIFLSILNSEATPTQIGLGRHHRVDFTQDLSRNEDAFEPEPKETGGNLQEEPEQVMKELKGLLRKLRQLGSRTVQVKSRRARDNELEEARGQNWKRSGIEFRYSRSGLHDNCYGTLTSKGWC